MKRLIKSFTHAFHGIIHNYKTQPNFRIHTIFAITAIILAFILKFSYIEWAILAITIFLVFAAEAFNTAIEEAVNCATKEMNDTAKIAKDSAAAGVLILSISSLVVGAILYLNKIIPLVFK